jgi:hypothetical protein
MGLNKRFLKKENILKNLDNIINYLNVEILFCTDEFSMQVYNFYKEGRTQEEIINYINKIK